MSEHSHILFSAGGLTLAADSSAVHCVHDGLTIQKEDDTVDWFLGLAVTDERLLPITDLGVYLQGNASSGRIIEIARSYGIAGLKIDEVHGVSKKLPVPLDSEKTVGVATSPLADSPLVDSPLKCAAVNDLGERYQLIDISSLLQSNRFLNVQHEPA